MKLFHISAFCEESRHVNVVEERNLHFIFPEKKKKKKKKSESPKKHYYSLFFFFFFLFFFFFEKKCETTIFGKKL